MSSSGEKGELLLSGAVRSDSTRSLQERRNKELPPVQTISTVVVRAPPNNSFHSDDSGGCIRKIDSRYITPESILSILGEEKRREYMEIFNVIDEDLSGEVTTEELISAFENMEVEMSREEIKSMVYKIDEDKSGAIDFEEFACVLFKLDQGLMDMHDNTQLEEETVEADPSFVENIRQELWALFDDPGSSKLAQIISLSIMVLIGISCTSFVVETLPDLQGSESKAAFKQLEKICIVLFTVEFACRILSCPNLANFCTSILNIIDFVAILPFYIEAASSSGEQGEDSSPSGAIRIVRLVRIFRVFKIGRYLTWFTVFAETLKESAAPLGMVVFVIAICTVLFSSLLFFVEKGMWSPELETFVLDDGYTAATFTSIPGTIWFTFSTMTTVGYGDVFPTSSFGKIISGISGVSGILILAVPISVISSNFSRQYAKMDKKAKVRKEESRKRKEIQAMVDKMVDEARERSQRGMWTLEEQEREEAAIRSQMYLETMLRSGKSTFKMLFKTAKNAEIANRIILKDRLRMVTQEYLGGRLEKRFGGEDGGVRKIASAPAAPQSSKSSSPVFAGVVQSVVAAQNERRRTLPNAAESVPPNPLASIADDDGDDDDDENVC